MSMICIEKKDILPLIRRGWEGREYLHGFLTRRNREGKIVSCCAAGAMLAAYYEGNGLPEHSLPYAFSVKTTGMSVKKLAEINDAAGSKERAIAAIAGYMESQGGTHAQTL